MKVFKIQKKIPLTKRFIDELGHPGVPLALYLQFNSHINKRKCK